jgi:predicted CXXCH cytochrome family protein
LFFDHAPASPKEDRFQIVNSVYRLRMSACFTKSNGALGCTTCHDPHNITHDASATQHYNSVCRQCHTTAFGAMVTSGQHTASTNCVECHMPKRRTDDVVHAVMTDHYIQRNKPEGDLSAEIPESDGPKTVYHGDVIPYYPAPFERTPQNNLYLALAQVRDENNLDSGIGQFAEALEKYRPAQSEFYVEFADALLKHGQADRAIPEYEEALRRKPDSLAGLLGLGKAFEKSGQHAEATTVFRRGTQLYPEDARFWQTLGGVYVKQGQRAEALAALQKSLELNWEQPDTHLALGTLFAQQGDDAARAEASFREAIRLEPNSAQAHTNLAILLSQQNRIEEASYHFEYALRLQPDYVLGHLNYGVMLSNVGRIDDAVQQMQAAVQLNPNLAGAHEILGKLEEMRGKIEEAIRQYSEAVRIDPQSSQTQLELGAALARTGNLKEAAQHLKEAASSSDPKIQESARRLLSGLGK